MSRGMSGKSTPVRGRIASYVGPRLLASHTRAALEGLGYDVIPAITRGRLADAGWSPSIRLVDEAHYAKLPSIEQDPRTPIILIVGPRPRDIGDRRIVGRVSRPGRLSEIFPILQEKALGWPINPHTKPTSGKQQRPMKGVLAHFPYPLQNENASHAPKLCVYIYGSV